LGIKHREHKNAATGGIASTERLSVLRLLKIRCFIANRANKSHCAMESVMQLAPFLDKHLVLVLLEHHHKVLFSFFCGVPSSQRHRRIPGPT
jgi:hypothetical protein